MSTVGDLFDQYDEARAVALRTDLGKLGFVVSWLHVGRVWLARVSVKRVARTVERTGQTRADAIGKAVGTVGAILELREKRCHSTPKPSSSKKPRS